jgi:hypothetical protein
MPASAWSSEELEAWDGAYGLVRLLGWREPRRKELEADDQRVCFR